MKKSVLLILLTSISASGAQNKESAEKIRNYSGQVHALLQANIELSKHDAADSVIPVYFIGPTGNAHVSHVSIEPLNHKDAHFKATGLLPEPAKRLVYACANKEKENRSLSRQTYPEYCPCDFYSNLTENELEQLIKGTRPCHFS